MGGSPLVILNPRSNSGRAARLRKRLENALVGGKGDLALTGAPRDAERMARDAANSGRDIVVVGGDGTITEAANGILGAGTGVSLGVVPAGSGNDYAYETLRVPRDLRKALDVALNGQPSSMDVGVVNGRHFLNSLGVGLDANIAAAAEKLKRYPFLRGQTLYWTASLRELLFHYDQCPELTVQVDDEPAERRIFALAAVSIGPTYGGGFRINPDADPRDCLFDLCTIWKPSLPRALRLLPKVEKGKHLAEREVTRTRVRQVLLEADRPIHAHLDGEVMLERRFEVTILPGALRVRQ